MSPVRVGTGLLGIVAITVLGGAGSAVAADVTAPPTLTGEYFVENFSGIPGEDWSPPTQCNPEGTSEFSFHASGVATGPYPGTFSEHGTVTIGPQTLGPVGLVPNPAIPGWYVPGTRGFHSGVITTLEVDFTIDSPAGQVVGTKTVSVAGPHAVGYCVEVSSAAGGVYPELGLPADGMARGMIGTVEYSARITTDDGVFGDSGLALLEGENGYFSLPTVDRGAVLGNFHEFFNATQNSTVPLLPTTKKQCRDGGWTTAYAVFKNQGDCVSFVATRGGNPPNG